MNDPLTRLVEALAGVDAAWPLSAEGARVPVGGLDAAHLVSANENLARLRRHLDALHAQVASEIARQSRPEDGADGIAKQQGFRSPVALVAATTGTSTSDAARLVAVGDAIAPRQVFGAEAPAKHPHVAAALAAGEIGLPAASAIVAMLDRVVLRCDRAAVDAAEARLVAQAVGLTLEQLGKVLVRAEAHLDPGGVQPREEELRADRALHMVERGGMLHLRATLDPEVAAPVKAAIEALVTAEFRARAERAVGAEEADVARRTVPQMQADALALLASHYVGCDRKDVPVDGATVIVRMTLDDLTRGDGIALIDGIQHPVSVATARRMAAGGGIIPCVLGSDGDILDWGREKRLFTRAQRLALTERDGGCAMCGLPPGMTKAHHIRWWARDAGPTDLANGVLLCESCHHRIHDNGWEIRVEGTGVSGQVWFHPPAHIDPTRTPRLGGRARYDYAA